jgi:hypothetical protein
MKSVCVFRVRSVGGYVKFTIDWIFFTGKLRNLNNNTQGQGDPLIRKQQQPLSAISIQDLNSVQVSRKSN